MATQQTAHRPRSQAYAHHTKRAVVGKAAGTVPPAWRTTVAQVRPAYYDQQRRQGGELDAAPHGGHAHEKREPPRPAAVGSKILMSQLPLDTVYERDIEELFAETIGPVFDVFVIHNSNGRSKGMAVVNFQRTGDAAEARRKYNGKIIDGRRPLKIELITDPPEALAPPVRAKSLLERIEGSDAASVNGYASLNLNARISNIAVPTPAHAPAPRAPHARPQVQRRVFKKGPRRIKKSVEQLDREMEAYRAATAHFSQNGLKTAAVNQVTTDVLGMVP